MDMRRVVVTGMGTVNPIGNCVEEFWENAKAGKIGIAPATQFNTDPLKVKLAAEVKNFNPRSILSPKEVRRTERFVQLAMAAAKEAFEDSCLNIEDEDPFRIGVSVGSAIGGMSRIAAETLVIEKNGPGKVSPYTIPLTITNMISGNIAMMLGTMGHCRSVVSACATGTDSIGLAYREIQTGQNDVILAGGTDSVLCFEAASSFQQLTALSLSEDPSRASIPFDRDRSGFVMGEGAGVIVLEELEHAKKRGAHIYGEVTGYGSTNDAWHITRPRDDAGASSKALQFAMEDAGITPDRIDYINAHGTSTIFNDLCETRAMKAALGKYAYTIPVNSTKSMIGHTMGASGTIEAIVCLMTIRDNFIHPTAGTEICDDECDINIIKHTGIKADVRTAMTNSFGFGGHNASLILSEYAE